MKRTFNILLKIKIIKTFHKIIYFTLVSGVGNVRRRTIFPYVCIPMESFWRLYTHIDNLSFPVSYDNVIPVSTLESISPITICMFNICAIRTHSLQSNSSIRLQTENIVHINKLYSTIFLDFDSKL